jgi:hypothetical protein
MFAWPASEASIIACRRHQAELMEMVTYACNNMNDKH